MPPEPRSSVRDRPLERCARQQAGGIKCGALRIYTGYYNKSVDELIEQQSQETNITKRRQLVWQSERMLIEEDACPDFPYVRGITCRRAYVKGLASMVNSMYKGSGVEDVWLDK